MVSTSAGISRICEEVLLDFRISANSMNLGTPRISVKFWQKMGDESSKIQHILWNFWNFYQHQQVFNKIPQNVCNIAEMIHDDHLTEYCTQYQKYLNIFLIR